MNLIDRYVHIQNNIVHAKDIEIGTQLRIIEVLKKESDLKPGDLVRVITEYKHMCPSCKENCTCGRVSFVIKTNRILATTCHLRLQTLDNKTVVE